MGVRGLEGWTWSRPHLCVIESPNHLRKILERKSSYFLQGVVWKKNLNVKFDQSDRNPSPSVEHKVPD